MTTTELAGHTQVQTEEGDVLDLTVHFYHTLGKGTGYQRESTNEISQLLLGDRLVSRQELIALLGPGRAEEAIDAALDDGITSQ